MSRFKVEMIEEDDGYTSRQTLKATHDGKVLFEERDGGEPEDQSFYRDWSWVPDALKKAYALGLADGAALPSGAACPNSSETGRAANESTLVRTAATVHDARCMVRPMQKSLPENELVARIARDADADPRSVVRRLAGLPVRGRVARRIDAAIAKHGTTKQAPASSAA